MPITKTTLEEAKSLLQTPLETFAKRELEKRGGLGALQVAIRDLKGLPKNLLESLSSKLPAIVQDILDGPIYRRLVSARAQLSVVLFETTGTAATDFLNNIRIYRQQLGRLTEFVKSPAFDRLIKNQNQFHNFENLAAVLFDRQAGLIDRYSNLQIETQAYNGLARRLFPEEFSDLLIEDHHILEQRVFPTFQKTLQLLGWKSTDDIASIPLMKEFHTRSPKSLLPDIKSDLAEKTDFTTLSSVLQNGVKLNKIKTTDELLNAYEDVYRSTAIRDQVLPVLKEIRTQISIQQTLMGISKKK